MSGDGGTVRPVNGMAWTRRRIAALAAALAFLSAFVTPLQRPDEVRYAEIAREMMRSGDFLVPRFCGEEHMTKPPLAYWASAAGMELFGVGVFGARILACLAGMLTVLAVGSLGDVLYARPVGDLAALVHATAFVSFALHGFLSTDVFLALFDTAGVVCGLLALRSTAGAGRAWRLACAACFGLAFMTKGPPALLALVPLVFIAIRQRRRQNARLLTLGALAVFCVIALPWYLIIVFRDPDRLHYFLVQETWERVMTARHNREMGRWIYFAALTVGFLPWTAGFWPLAHRAWVWWRRRPRRIGTPEGVLLTWLSTSLIVFCLSRSRLILYVGPLFGPLAVALAAAWRHPEERPPTALTSKAWPVLLTGALLLAMSIVARRIHTGTDDARMADALLARAGARPIELIVDSNDIMGVAFHADPARPPRLLERHSLQVARTPASLDALGVTASPGRATFLLVKKDDASLPFAELERLEKVAEAGRWVALRVD